LPATDLRLAGLTPCSTGWAPPLDAFLPIFLTLAASANLFTALLLVVQFRATGYIALVLLSIAYTTTAILIVAQSLAFPEVFGPEGLLGARPHTVVRLWAAWHVLFPLLVGVYAIGRRIPDWRVEPRRSYAVGVLALGIVLGLAIAAIAFRAASPLLIESANYRAAVHSI